MTSYTFPMASGSPTPSFTVTLSEERALRLEELARKAGVSPEEFLRSSVEEWLARAGNDFAQAADYVLNKNAELYRRLA